MERVTATLYYILTVNSMYYIHKTSYNLNFHKVLKMYDFWSLGTF